MQKAVYPATQSKITCFGFCFPRGNCSLSFNFPPYNREQPWGVLQQAFQNKHPTSCCCGEEGENKPCSLEGGSECWGGRNPPSEDSRSLGALDPGLAAPSLMLAESVQCLMSHFKGRLCGSLLKSFILRKPQQLNKPKQGLPLNLLTHGCMF